MSGPVQGPTCGGTPGNSEHASCPSLASRATCACNCGRFAHPSAARRAIEAVLVVGLLAAGRGRKDLSASPAREPILSVPLGVFLLHLILTGFAHNAFHRECHHVGVEVLNGLWLIALIAFQLGDGPAAGKALPVMLLLQLRSWKGILYLG